MNWKIGTEVGARSSLILAANKDMPNDVLFRQWNIVLLDHM